jgi:2-polyprenyl-6-hydroxyphenyl methylase/3-demethylubiquinone-9 3-methyltransferase
MNASAATPSTATDSRAHSVDPKEAEHFGKLAAEWWDPKGSSAMLHRLNPPRLGYIREAINRHWDLDEHDRHPLAGKSAADIGCGAGLLAEPLARLGAAVTGIDAAEENIAAARAHAAQSGLAIDYRAGGIEAAAGTHDLVTCMEVVEHVTDPEQFVRGLADALKPDGMLIMSTPNRTGLSKLAMITVGEGAGLIPKGTHDWDKFLTPEELTGLLEKAGLTVTDVSGLSFSPARGFEISERTALNYLVTAKPSPGG